MIITLEKWNNYFSLSLTELPFGAREETIALAFLYNTFPNLPKYEKITIAQCITNFENALMEQIEYFYQNDKLQNGSISTSGGFSIEGYSENGLGNSTDVNSKSSVKRLSPIAYDYLSACGFTNMALGYCGGGLYD